MKYKIIIPGLILLSTCAMAYSQHNFDSIKICHAKGGLRDIAIGEYEVRIKEGQLSSLLSKDGAVSYEANNKLLVLKNLIKGSSLSLQLSNEGVVVKTKDTSFVLNNPKSINLLSSNDGNEAEVLHSLGDFSFMLKFSNGRLSKMGLPTTGKYIFISFVQDQGIYTWDFSIESSGHRNKVVLTNVFGKPYLLSISDDENKVGIRLLARKKNGVFSDLVGQRVYANGSFVSDNSYKLQYTSDGKLKKKTSKYNLACEE
jgi:hypothetical protein